MSDRSRAFSAHASRTRLKVESVGWCSLHLCLRLPLEQSAIDPSSVVAVRWAIAQQARRARREVGNGWGEWHRKHFNDCNVRYLHVTDVGVHTHSHKALRKRIQPPELRIRQVASSTVIVMGEFSKESDVGLKLSHAPAVSISSKVLLAYLIWYASSRPRLS